MIRNLINFVALVGFTLMLPLFCGAAWFWSSKDEKWLMRVAFCSLSPFCAVLWYIVASHLVLHRKSSYLIQFLVFVGIAGVVFLLLEDRVITF
jgi:hypothetical protein